MSSTFAQLIEYDRQVTAAEQELAASKENGGTEGLASVRGEGTRGGKPKLRSRSLTHALAQRGNLKTHIGLANAGLYDLLYAYRHQTVAATKVSSSLEELLTVYMKERRAFAESWLEARLGECLRVYVRDTLLSQPKQLNDVQPIVLASLECYTRALDGASASARTWILAHRAACMTMLSWVRVASGDSNADPPLSSFDEAPRLAASGTTLLQQAEQDFLAARDGYPKENRWCERFYAFFLALRGGPGDFSAAAQILESCQGVDGYDASLDRHQAMLFSYKTHDPNAEIATRAARASLEKALKAVTADSEDFVASYFGTYSLYWLAHHCQPSTIEDSREQESYRRALGSAIQAARIRSRNIISQAHATLVGLALIEAMHLRDEKAMSEVRKSLNELSTFADLETRTMFLRDPMWQVLEKAAKGDAKYLPGDAGRALEGLCKSIHESFVADYDAVRMPMK